MCALLLRSWILRTFWVGYRRDLEVTDLYKPLNEHTSGILGVKIADAWEKECKAAQRRGKGAQPSLLRVIIRCFGCKIILYGMVLAVMEISLRYVYNRPCKRDKDTPRELRPSSVKLRNR